MLPLLPFKYFLAMDSNYNGWYVHATSTGNVFVQTNRTPEETGNLLPGLRIHSSRSTTFKGLPGTGRL